MDNNQFKEYKKQLIDYIDCFVNYNDLYWFLRGVLAQASIMPETKEKE